LTGQRDRAFFWALAGIATVGLVIRVAYLWQWGRHLNYFGGDGYFYHEGANLLARGRGFISPYELLMGRVSQAAEHPPLYMMYLAIPSLLGMTSTLTHLLWSCVLGTGTIVVVSLLGRLVGGVRVGIVAAVIAALDSNIWAPDGSLQAETMAMFQTALALLFAYWYWRRPSWGRLAACGAACGAAALSRTELILLVPLMLVPLPLLTRGVDVKVRLRWLGIGVLTTLVVIGPWVGYNLVRFRQPELLSSQFGALLASANCDDIWFTGLSSYFSIACTERIRAREIQGGLDESQTDAIYRREAVHYIVHHKRRLPRVVAARVGAILGVHRPTLQIRLDYLIEARENSVAHSDLYFFYVVAVLAAAGSVVIRRRRVVPLFPLLSVPATVLVTVVVTYASTRFRATAEIALAVLAAVAVDAGWRAARGRRRADSVGHRPADAIPVQAERGGAGG
jgi:4-amino-4-deoxy-L-arabinose transferase-like glycosyltransferase